MTKRTITAVGVIVVFLVSGIATVAWAGIGTSPFQPEINRLNAIDLNLQSLEKRVDDVIEAVLGYPPEPCGPKLNSAVNKLSSIGKQLTSLDELMGFVVHDVIEAVLGVPPQPCAPDTTPVIDALNAIMGSAGGIVERIEAVLGYPPQPCAPEFLGALVNVKGSAETIVNNASQYILDLQYNRAPSDVIE
ncbi:MAG: hypothetical protein JRJ25_08695 [Deltaproteobacteria bacterium]|nr:hypothetical protein [Deltaproteobacteria bacterium]